MLVWLPSCACKTLEANQFMRIVTMISMSAALAAGCSAPSSEAPAQQPSPFQAVASVQELMRAITIPSSNAVFAAQSEAPQDAAGWLSLQNNAVLLAESGNLLMIGARARDHGNWDSSSRALIDAAALALTAARAKDSNKLGQAADAVYAACEGCHEQYLPK
jgi:hypothetical protein